MTNTYIGRKMHTIYKLAYRFGYIEFLKLSSAIRYKLARPFKCRLAIIDDLIPNPIGGFRSNEFAYLLNRVPDSFVFSIIGSKINKKKQFEYYKIKSVGEFRVNRAQFCEEYKLEQSRIRPFFTWTKIKPDIAYVVFLENAYYLIDYFEENDIKFVLELYPGGGFGVLTEGPEYERLKRVMASPCLQTVFVTQKLSYEFLIQQKLVDRDKIVFHYGGILSPLLFGKPEKTDRYPITKNVIDVCFVAAKYVPKGIDKGYDIFIEAALAVLRQGKEIFRFHVVGNFDETDIPIDAEYLKYFRFYGMLKADDFAGFYETQDIIISPSRPFIRSKGQFDGFPTTVGAEAGLYGVCVMLSDPLDLNVSFTNNEHLIILDNDAGQFAEKLSFLAENPDEIYRIGANSKRAIEADPPENQLSVRLSLINDCLKSDTEQKK